MYFNGLGTEKSAAQAAIWYRRAADRGLLDAEVQLAELYEDGDGVPKDDAEAARLYAKAAEHENVEAQYHLGLMYEDGRGVAKNLSKAIDLYRRASDRGNCDAANNLGALFLTGDAGRKDETEAFKLFRSAATYGSAEGQYNLAVMYAAGRGVMDDPSYSQFWSGRIVTGDRRSNMDHALVWFRRAAMQGQVNAQLKLASAYETGAGVAKDGSQALIWYRKAADQGDAKAREALGRLQGSGADPEVDKPSEIRTAVFDKFTGYAGLSCGPAGPYMPDRACRNGVGGAAVIDCETGPDGGLYDCSIVSESLRDFGFGPASLAMARARAITVPPTPNDPGGFHPVRVVVPLTFTGGYRSAH